MEDVVQLHVPAALPLQKGPDTNWVEECVDPRAYLNTILIPA